METPKGRARLYVIKIGGNVIDNSSALYSFLADFTSISVDEEGRPCRKILVHGGGKVASDMGSRLGITSRYVSGRRITDDDTIDLVTMVYGGLVNKKIVAQLQSLGCNAIGLTGADGNLVPAVKRPVKEVDFGWVGDINAPLVAETWQFFLANGLVPIVAPLTHDGQGHMLNTNADTIASSLAIGLSSLYDVRLIYCFEKKGVLENVEEENSVIRLIDKAAYRQLLSDEKLFAGILPKIDNAFAAIDAGVQEVLIGDAKDILQNTGSHTKGTLIV